MIEKVAKGVLVNRYIDTQTHLPATWLVAKTLPKDTLADKRLGLLQITKSLSPHHRVRVTEQTRKRGGIEFYVEMGHLKYQDKFFYCVNQSHYWKNRNTLKQLTPNCRGLIYFS